MSRATHVMFEDINKQKFIFKRSDIRKVAPSSTPGEIVVWFTYNKHAPIRCKSTVEEFFDILR